VFDFQGASLTGLDRASGVVAVTNVPQANLALASAVPLGGPGGLWRATIDVRTQGLVQDEFRLFLRRGNDALGETVIKTVRP
jgi:glucans biosynthesis protein